MIEKIIRKSLVNIFMLIQTWMSSDIAGWQFVVWIVTTNLFRPRKSSENVAVPRNLWRNELVESLDGDNTFAPTSEHLILRFFCFIPLKIDNLRIECKSTEIAKKENIFIHNFCAASSERWEYKMNFFSLFSYKSRRWKNNKERMENLFWAQKSWGKKLLFYSKWGAGFNNFFLRWFML